MAAVNFGSVERVGRMKTAVATARCKRGRGLIKINGCPIELLEPEFIRKKATDTINGIGSRHFDCVDVEVDVADGGSTKSKMYAIRQAIAKALVAFYTDYVDDDYQMKKIKDKIYRFDRSLLVADPNELGA